MRITPMEGSPLEIGLALGELARPVMADYLAQSGTWRRLQDWRGHPILEALASTARARTPHPWQELQGMARALDMPADDLFLWNCRGDLLHAAREGCTSVAVHGADGARWIGHNEDGDPFLKAHGQLVDVRPAQGPGFVSFYYPGSLPGHTFAATRAGLAQTINNLRVTARSLGVPRMFLARAVLDCADLDEALDLLQDAPRAGGFHHTLGSAADPDLYSVEASGRWCSVLEVEQAYGHANHMIHPGSGSQAQIVTASSAARQQRIDELLRGIRDGDVAGAILAALRDNRGELPILRQSPDDPDEENTLATAIFRLDAQGVRMAVYGGEDGQPVGEIDFPAVPR